MREYINLVRLNERTEDYEHELTLHLRGDFVNSLVEFLQKVKDVAAGGHSFAIEADRECAGEYDDGECPHVYIDGDGADCIVNIFLDGKKLKD